MPWSPPPSRYRAKRAWAHVADRASVVSTAARLAARSVHRRLTGAHVPSAPLNRDVQGLVMRSGRWVPNSRAGSWTGSGGGAEDVAAVEERRRRAASVRRALGLRPKSYSY